MVSQEAGSVEGRKGMLLSSYCAKIILARSSSFAEKMLFNGIFS